MHTIYENYGRFYVSLAYVDNSVIDYRSEVAPHSLKQCMDFIEYRMNHNDRVVLGILCDWDTGEVVLSIERN